MIKQIFVNMPVENLDKSISFFTKLGFEFDPRFTDVNATCMIIGEDIYAMLLTRDTFKSFIPAREIADTTNNTEVITALSVENNEEVDRMVNNAIAAGGSEYREASDYGWMFLRAFKDLDGHIWEIFQMDEAGMPEEMKNKGDAK